MPSALLHSYHFIYIPHIYWQEFCVKLAVDIIQAEPPSLFEFHTIDK